MSNSNNKNNNKQLSFLSDEKLLDQTKILVQKERNINFHILRHLEEIEARKLYLSRGFSSLFDYAIKELGYSGSAASRRIKAMRLCKDIPGVETKLKSGKLSLTTALQLQQFFEKTKAKAKRKNQNCFVFTSVGESAQTGETDVKKTEETILNKNQETQNFSSHLQETKSIKQKGGVKETQKSIKNQENKNFMIQDLNKTQKVNLIKKVEGKSSREVEKILTQLTNTEVFLKDKVKYVNPNKIKMNIVVHEKCFKNLEKLKHLLSHKNPNMSYGDLLFTLSEVALDKYDPKRRYERRLSKKENNLKQQSKSKLLSIGSNALSEGNNDKVGDENNYFQKQKRLNESSVCYKQTRKSLKESNNFQKQKNLNKSDTCHKQIRKNLTVDRYISTRVRDYVWSRDKGQCTYVCSKTNKKCSSKHLLQVDHIQPFSLGGSHSSKNLRLLCAFHNQYRNRMNGKTKTLTWDFR